MQRQGTLIRAYTQTILGWLLASILIAAALALAYWGALLLRLLVNTEWPAFSDVTQTKLEILGRQSAQYEFSVYLVLAFLALVLASVPVQRMWIFAPVIAGVYCLGYFAMDIPRAIAPMAAGINPRLATRITDGVSRYTLPLLISDLVGQYIFFSISRHIVKGIGVSKNIKLMPVVNTSYFLPISAARRYATIPAASLLLTACLSVAAIMRSAIDAFHPNLYVTSNSGFTWAFLWLALIAASFFVCTPHPRGDRRLLIACLTGGLALALCPHAVTLPSFARFANYANAFWISVLIYPSAASIGFTAVARCLRWTADS